MLLLLQFLTILSNYISAYVKSKSNIIKFKNPFYPSIGYNKLDFMTQQNPKEFKLYIEKRKK